jgi:uncharacterized protein (TIGR02118 family)
MPLAWIDKPGTPARRLAVTVKIVALWTTPTDMDGFEEHYLGTHWPLVADVPGLQSAVGSKALDGPYYRMAELVFADGDGIAKAMASAEGQKLLADAGHLQETYGPKLEVLTVEEQTRI